MPAYVISEVETLDEDSLEKYRDLAKASIEKHGGRYLCARRFPKPQKEIGRRSDGSSSSSSPICKPRGGGTRRRTTAKRWRSETAL
jgi:hypothetical protein